MQNGKTKQTHRQDNPCRFSEISPEEIVYTHFFYIPIVLTGVWYHKKAVYTALLLSIVHILVTYLSVQVITIDNFARCAILIAVAYVIGLISQKRAKGEEALAASKVYAESIIQNFLDTLIVVDAEANIQTVNPETCHLLGYTKEELIGKPISAIFAAEEEKLIIIEDITPNASRVKNGVRHTFGQEL